MSTQKKPSHFRGLERAANAPTLDHFGYSIISAALRAAAKEAQNAVGRTVFQIPVTLTVGVPVDVDPVDDSCYRVTCEIAGGIESYEVCRGRLSH